MTLASATRNLPTPRTRTCRIDDVADPAGAGVVVDRQGKMQGEIFQERVTGLPASDVPMLCREKRRDQYRVDLVVRWPVCRDLQGPSHHRYHDLHVMRIVVVVHADGRMHVGIGALQHDFPLAVRQRQIGQEIDACRIRRQPSYGQNIRTHCSPTGYASAALHASP
jgi:hypothetical protein